MWFMDGNFAMAPKLFAQVTPLTYLCLSQLQLHYPNNSIFKMTTNHLAAAIGT